MKRKRRKTKSLIGLLVLAGILASSAYAFTASIAVNGTYQAGDSGAKVIAPGSVSAKYVLDASNPLKISKVNLTFDATGGATIPSTTSTVEVSVVTPVVWQTCTNVTASTWSCTYAVASEPTLANAANLQVIQADT